MTISTKKNSVVPRTALPENSPNAINKPLVSSKDGPFLLELDTDVEAKKMTLSMMDRKPTRDLAAVSFPRSSSLGQRKEQQRTTAQESRVLKKSVSDMVTYDSSFQSDSTNNINTRARSVSVGDAGSRRSIFGQYWNKKQNLSETDDSIRIGDPSSPVPVPNTRMPPVDVDIRAFSPPEEHRPSVTSGHFSRIDDFFPAAAFPPNDSLPPVPTPLRRYCSDGMHPGGVYPLVSPRPILRTRRYGSSPPDSSVDHSHCEERSPVKFGSKAYTSSTPEKNPPRQSPTWAFTASPALNPVKQRNVLHVDMKAMDPGDSVPPLCHHDSDSSSERQVVKFDPRVTITEFEERAERQWFSDSELMAFKVEATVLAQRYMKNHPQVAEAFREGRRDPITGMRRQRAMYTNPVFSTSEEGSSEDSEALKELVASEVKRILVVDPNKTILMLFSRSFRNIFPHAELSAAQNGEEALRAVMAGVSRDNEFDIIVVEERLARRRRTASFGAQHEMLLIDRQSSAFQQKKRPSFSDIKGIKEQLGTIEKRDMSGSELLKRISQLQDQMSIAADCASVPQAASNAGTSPETASSAAAVHLVPKPIESWRSLLIGVSVELENEGPKLSESGADILWGKPPPPMDSNLRNELLYALLAKRHRSHSG